MFDKVSILLNMVNITLFFKLRTVICLQGAQGPTGGVGAMGGNGEKVRTRYIQTHSIHFNIPFLW